MRADARDLLVFQVAGHLCALPVEAVQEIVPMATLARAPGQPAVLEGFLNLRGVAVPVVRMYRLFELPPVPTSLYTPLIVLRSDKYATALLVDSVVEIVSAPAEAFSPLNENSCFNDCSEAQVQLDNSAIHLLSSQRLLLEKERHSIAEFQGRAQQIIDELEFRPA